MWLAGSQRAWRWRLKYHAKENVDYDGTTAGELPGEGACDLLFADAFLFLAKLLYSMLFFGHNKEHAGSLVPQSGVENPCCLQWKGRLLTTGPS